ncbi:MAG: hypothetical protein GY906_27010 [bacterium]|nr:hypothetical protein [bacterium]
MNHVWTCRFVSAAIVWAMTLSSASAQRFGQWTWDAIVGAEQQRFTNAIDGAKSAGYDNQQLKASLGLNGFIFHPALAAFRLRLDGLLSRSVLVNQRQNNRLGGRADLRLFPRGAYAINLHLAHHRYEYSVAQGSDPLRFIGVPDYTTSYGARVRVRHGLLRGLIAGLERNELDFVDLTGRQVNQRGFVDWSRAGKNINHHTRLEHRHLEYASIDYSTDDVTLTLNEHGPLSPTWRWDLSGVAIHRTVGGAENQNLDTTSARLRNRFIHPTPNGGTLDLSYSAGMVTARGSSTQQGHELSGRYVWRPWMQLEVAPFSAVTIQKSSRFSALAPRVGLGLTMNTSISTADASLTATGSYGKLTRNSKEEPTLEQSFFAGSLGASIAHGDESTMHKRLDLIWSRNELQQVGDSITVLPDLGASLAAGGIVDRFSGRLSFARRWGSFHANFFSDWSQRRSTGDSVGEGFLVDRLVHTLQIDGRRFGLQVNGGETAIRQETRQTVRYLSVGLSWRPRWYLSFQLSYRDDLRQLDLGPGVDGSRFQSSVEVNFGRFLFRGDVFQTIERQVAGIERVNRGFSWSLSRRFGGLLPLVTGPQRKGVIR